MTYLHKNHCVLLDFRIYTHLVPLCVAAIIEFNRVKREEKTGKVKKGLYLELNFPTP